MDETWSARLPALRTGLGARDGVLVAPGRAARQTAEDLGFAVTVEPALRDCDFGRWSGQPMAAIEGEEPELFRHWLSDPATAPPGGEALVEVLGRMGAWLNNVAATPGNRCAILSGYATRAIVVAALDLPLAVFWRLDAAPLSVTRLTAQGSRWRLACFGATA